MSARKNEKSTVFFDDVILVSTADWDNPFWTNKQHVALQLAKRGHRVFYIESMGLRRPSATARDFSRIFRRLQRGLMPPRRVHPNLWVWSPLSAPMHNSSFFRVLNNIFLKLGLSLWTSIIGIKSKILWTYSPLTVNYYNLKKFDKVIYHAVDDIKAQPGMPKEAIAEAEEKLTRQADLIFVTSQNLLEVHAKDNPNTHYFSNVADFDHFQVALDPETIVPDDLASIPGPRLGLIGAISGYKVDFDIICEMARARPSWSIVLIGDVGEGDPWTDASRLREYSNIYLLGTRPYQTLPAYLKGMDVALLVTPLNEYTKSMFPMKFFEYLAAGRRVVSTRLPALNGYDDIVAFCDTKDQFVSAIEDVFEGKGATLEQRVGVAKANTYASRTEKMMQIVEALP